VKPALGFALLSLALGACAPTLPPAYLKSRDAAESDATSSPRADTPPAASIVADCTADQCGHCVPLALLFHVGQVLLDFTSSSCVYEGPCRSDSCAGCMTSWEHDKTLKAFHACMP